MRHRFSSAATFVLSLCLAAGAAAQTAPLPPATAQWKPGVNYTVISPAQPINAPAGKVQVIEFFYLACPFCHALEPHMLAWRKTKPAYVQFVRVPVMWAPLQMADARLYYTLEALGRDDLVETAFNTIHQLEVSAGGNENVMVGSTPAQTFKLQEAFAEQHGVSAAAFANAYNSFDVNTELQQATQLGQTYQVMNTPTIIIDGRYKTGPSMAGRGDTSLEGMNNRTIALINYLTKWDHDHSK